MMYYPGVLLKFHPLLEMRPEVCVTWMKCWKIIIIFGVGIKLGLPTIETLTRLGLYEAGLKLASLLHTNEVHSIYASLGWAAPYTNLTGDFL